MMQRFQAPGAILPGGMGGVQPNRPMERFQPGGQAPNIRQSRNPRGFDTWIQNLEVAKRQAATEGKDLFILFDGSDWCSYSIRLADEVLFQPVFQEQIRQKFVLVFLDFPKGGYARGRVMNQAQNARLMEEFDIEGFPTVILADAQARAYAIDGFREGGHEAYLANLLQQQEVRVERDRLIDEVARAQGLDKLKAALRVIEFLRAKELTHYYSSLYMEWAALARTLDADNEHTYNEQFFEMDWVLRVIRSDPEKLGEVKQLIGELQEWKRAHERFKNDDRGARVHILAVAFLAAAKQNVVAEKYLKDAQVYRPTDPKLQEILRVGTGMLQAGTGTGYVVAEGGYILTNYHVAGGPGEVKVRLPNVKEPLPAQIIAQNEKRDLALIRIKVPHGVRLKPLTIAGRREVRRGEQVAVFGYPLGELFGSGLKLTIGVVSGLPEERSRNMLMLDARVNPGNSGGPLCDTSGNVVGMVTRKSFSASSVDSYGMAIPAPDLEAFLRQHLKSYKPREPARKAKPWDEVDQMVSGSVLMILKEK